ncbi:TetR/AcrR family transcriptional regulator [Cohnella cholangitidis]|uniref:TetR/AcrR family transcriptional regulator n=1 Tax=Cohnella cholangitidis TaxID=2598458 RepID=A0A7G5C4D2_9BACL|nr:TetR-like C-terminal domain-containing protein [Cohnella cholangitidis]QMV44066.1 TetR/AcrR family transcriptional regulator [Cohnella cholangitidis]
MNPNTSRTDPRILRTRQLLGEALIDLLEEMDIEKITVNRIAERATINRVTFYLHYRDIPDMLDKMADGMIAEIKRALNDSPANPSPTDEYWPMMVSLLEHIAERGKFFKVIFASRKAPVFTERLLKLLAELVAARIEKMESGSYITTAGIQKDIAIWYCSSALIGTIVSWLRNDMPYTPTYLAKQFALLRPH